MGFGCDERPNPLVLDVRGLLRRTRVEFADARFRVRQSAGPAPDLPAVREPAGVAQ